MFKKRNLTLFFKDRLVVGLMGVLLVQALVLLIVSLLGTKFSDVQIPTRYSSYGLTTFYRDQWYFNWFFGLFGVLVFGFNGFLAYRLNQAVPLIAKGVILLSIFICVIALIIENQVLHLSTSLL